MIKVKRSYFDTTWKNAEGVEGQKVDFNKKYIRRFKAYLKIIGAEQGDQIRNHDFLCFIDLKWREYDKMTNKPDWYPKTDAIQDEFDDFLETGQVILF